MYGPELFSGLISTTSSVAVIAARISCTRRYGHVQIKTDASYYRLPKVFIEHNGRRTLKISFSFTLWPSESRKCQICEIKSSVSEIRSRVIV